MFINSAPIQRGKNRTLRTAVNCLWFSGDAEMSRTTHLEHRQHTIKKRGKPLMLRHLCVCEYEVTTVGEDIKNDKENQKETPDSLKPPHE